MRTETWVDGWVLIECPAGWIIWWLFVDCVALRMNQTAEECKDPFPPSSAGHRLSLTDLFCTEPFPPPSPTAVSAAVAAAAAAASGLEGFRFSQSPQSLLVSSTNPFYADLLADESYQLAQPYLHDQFQWKHSLQPKYRVNDYLSYHPNVSFQR